MRGSNIKLNILFLIISLLALSLAIGSYLINNRNSQQIRPTLVDRSATFPAQDQSARKLTQQATHYLRSAIIAKQQWLKTPLKAEGIIEAEQLLTALGYWGGPVDGKLDSSSRHAFIAFQKVEGRKPTGRLIGAELELLREAKRPIPQEGGPMHIEVDLNRQVLFLVDDGGTISRILPISSGNDKPYTTEESGAIEIAHTPRGRFKVTRKIPEWRESPLGLLYYPSYIYRGIAIHGNPAVPTTPASHGCIRVPMFAAQELYNLMPVGTPVIIYDRASTLM